MKTPTVILLSSSADAVGVSSHVLELARVLSENKLLDTVLCPKKGWLSKQLEENNIPCVILDISHRPFKFIVSSLNLANFLKTKPTNTIVHLHGRLPLFVAMYSLFIRRDLSFAITIHQFSNAGSHGNFRWKFRLETYLLRYMVGICCVSIDLQAEVVCRVGKKQGKFVTTIPNWIRPLWYSGKTYKRTIIQNEGDKINSFSICAIGRLTYAKGFDILINAIDILTKSGMSINCDIYGDGEEKIHLNHLVQTLHLGEKIFFKGSVSDVRTRLPHYSTLVVPSRTESFGLVILEAYDAAVPVIASNILGVTSIVSNGKTGILFQPDNPESLAEGIKDVLQERVDVCLLINNAYEVLRRHAPNSTLIDKYKMFYMRAQYRNSISAND